MDLPEFVDNDAKDKAQEVQEMFVNTFSNEELENDSDIEKTIKTVEFMAKLRIKLKKLYKTAFKEGVDYAKAGEDVDRLFDDIEDDNEGDEGDKGTSISDSTSII